MSLNGQLLEKCETEFISFFDSFSFVSVSDILSMLTPMNIQDGYRLHLLYDDENEGQNKYL